MKRVWINSRSIESWKSDVRKSVLFYNDWFLHFAPDAYIGARNSAIQKVARVFEATKEFRKLSSSLLSEYPESTEILRMSTTPPLARDRLAGLADVSRTLIKSLENGKATNDEEALTRIVSVICSLLDRDIMPWLNNEGEINRQDVAVASAIIGDRLCGSLADPIIRNEQERRQFKNLDAFLTRRGYFCVEAKEITDFRTMSPGTFAHHLNIPAKLIRKKTVDISVDVVIMRKGSKTGDLPLLIECKSAGDFTNTNKRRKEEAVKMAQLKDTYGKDVEFVLFLCGYFDGGYLGYEAAEGIDWVWEHRIEDLEKAGV